MCMYGLREGKGRSELHRNENVWLERAPLLYLKSSQENKTRTTAVLSLLSFFFVEDCMDEKPSKIEREISNQGITIERAVKRLCNQKEKEIIYTSFPFFFSFSSTSKVERGRLTTRMTLECFHFWKGGIVKRCPQPLLSILCDEIIYSAWNDEKRSSEWCDEKWWQLGLLACSKVNIGQIFLSKSIR